MGKNQDIEPVRSDIADLARKFGRSKVKAIEHADKLRQVGFSEDDLTNNALVVASVFANAVNGDMQAVCKWQELTGEIIAAAKEDDEIGDILTDRESNGKSGAVRKDRTKLSN